MMRHFLALSPKYLAAHPKKTRLIITSVALSVALVTGIFSMLEVFLQFEKIQTIKDKGNFHIAVVQASEAERAALRSRTDVKNAGRWLSLGEVSANGVTSRLGALEQDFAENMNVHLIEGHYPLASNEIMIEKWASDKLYLNTKLNSSVSVVFADGPQREFIVSGIYNDVGTTKAKGNPGIFVSIAAGDELAAALPETQGIYMIEFKRNVNIPAAEKHIMDTLQLDKNRIGHNEQLLAIIGQSENNAALGLYWTGGVLFFIVLIAGVMMIYNSFNISVLERVRQFGLLRCIGASRSQIRRLVRREALSITFRAIPLGLAAGMLMTLGCSAFLKYYNHTLFSAIPIFTLSPGGIAAGIAIGFLTVFTASLLPARKAAQVSPINAVTGSNEVQISRRKKKGLLTRIFHADIALGLGNVFSRKKTLLLMTGSIAISIVMFLGFQVFVDFLHTSLKTTKPSTPDISLVSAQGGINSDLNEQLKQLDGTKKVYGRMYAYVEASFDASRLSETYKKELGGVTLQDNGQFVPPEPSWLISYDKHQLDWAKADLLEGALSEEQLDAQNGVIAVDIHYRSNRRAETADLQLGDKVTIATASGPRELTVMGILRSIPHNSKELTLTSFITTEKLFTELTGATTYKSVDIQLQKSAQEMTVNEIKGMLDAGISFQDARQQNTELDQTFFTMAVFIYGFVGVIGLISVLNIINTMNTSIASKIRYLGVMRAVGMSGKQLNRMVLAEAGTYSFIGGIAGCLIGVALQKQLIETQLSSFNLVWEIPFLQIGLIFLLLMIITVISVISPIRRVKRQGISEVISSL